MMKHLAGLTAAAMAVVLAATSAAHAGRWNGPGDDLALVRPFSNVTYHDTFEGGEIALVTVVGDGDSRLGVEVFDANGNLVAADTGTSCLVTWVPRRTTKYTIKVINLGLDPNTYILKTN